MQSTLLLTLLAAATAMASPTNLPRPCYNNIARPGGNNIGNTAFNNLNQRPNLVQIHEPRPMPAPKCSPKEPKHFPILSNYNNQSPTKYQPQSPCYQPFPSDQPSYSSPCYSKPKHGQRKYDGCFGQEEDGEYQEFLALSDSGFGACCDGFQQKKH
jgi:hypothetical protein